MAFACSLSRQLRCSTCSLMINTLPKHLDWPKAEASYPPKLKMLREVRC